MFGEIPFPANRFQEIVSDFNVLKFFVYKENGLPNSSCYNPLHVNISFISYFTVILYSYKQCFQLKQACSSIKH